MQIPLSKTLLKEIVITTFAENALGFKFKKYNNRRYYFQRESKDAEITDFIRIVVNLKKGRILCILQSIGDKSLMNKFYVEGHLLNKGVYMKNTFAETNSFRENIIYQFDNNEESLKRIMEQILYDFNIEGKCFFNENDKRCNSEKYKIGQNFIRLLKVDKKELKKEFAEYKSQHINIRKIQNVNFCNLVSELQKNENENYNSENYMVAFEFLHKYIFE
ncbi:hypothetical protein KJK34_13810 [Flavobacterium sp. D11R37]|uniref:hypothetical protein n=1 Tax=Flavobacterium coralii TaxID=2838017 RepID=UPI001CA61777|nr:hypothetical protein [Flavobacterium coralii]MBY8963832.1 hypothetical protein [Flavobacterium coralii]